MKRVAFRALVTILILSGTTAAEAGRGSRTPLDQRLSHEGRDLVLRSASLKEVTFLKVNLYWVGLYLEAAGTPPDSIYSSNQVKAFVFHFLRDVKGAELQESWIRDLTVSCESDCRSVIAQGRALARKMPDIRSSQKIAYVLSSDRVDILIDGSILGTLVGANSSRAVLATFLGPKAPLKLRKDLINPLISPARR